jgi:hypothetical protein
MIDTKELTKDLRIKKEILKLQHIFSDLDTVTKNILDGLIKRAAYMRITLEDYEKDLDDDGYVEMFSQSVDVDPYERERPVARLYNTMNKNYQSIIKQLCDKLPDSVAADPSEEILKFAFKGKK